MANQARLVARESASRFMRFGQTRLIPLLIGPRPLTRSRLAYSRRADVRLGYTPLTKIHVRKIVPNTKVAAFSTKRAKRLD